MNETHPKWSRNIVFPIIAGVIDELARQGSGFITHDQIVAHVTRC
jgi:hypothetical protein